MYPRFHCSLVLLSDEYFVIPRTSDPCGTSEAGLHTYNTLGRLEVYHIPPQSSEHQFRRARCVASFTLPDLAVKQNELDISIRCGHAPKSIVSSPRSTLSRRSPKIFESAFGNFLLYVNISAYVYPTDGDAEGIFDPLDSAYGTLFLSSHTLLGLVHKKLNNGVVPTNLHDPVRVLWETWGHHTSWFNFRELELWRPRYTWGLCAAFVEEAPRHFGGQGLILLFLDFGPSRVKARRAGICGLVGSLYPSNVSDGGKVSISYDHQNVLEQAFLGGVAVAGKQYTMRSIPVEVEGEHGDTRVMISDEHGESQAFPLL